MPLKKEYLTIAVIGVGAMGQGHCATIAAGVPELRLGAVCDAHEATARAAGERFGVPWFTDVSRLLQAGCAEAALVVVPHPLHAGVAIPCMEAGLHVLCEKPLAETVGAADRMLEAARAGGVAFAAMFQTRGDPVVQRMIAFAQAGGIGRILRAELVVSEFRSQYYFDSNPWRATWRGEGGGVLLNQAAHLLDIFALVGGLPESLLARCETRQHDIEVEDTAEALLRYAGGGSGHLFCSTVEPPGGGGMEVVGDLGRATFRGGRVTLVRFPGGVSAFARTTESVWGKPPVETVFDGVCQEVPPQAAVLRNFARHVLCGEPLWCDAASGLASLELANGMALSSAAQRETALPVDRAAYDGLLDSLRARTPRPKRLVTVARVTDPKLTVGFNP